MIEPRRSPVKAAAARLAATLGEEIGERIGYAVREAISQTQVEVITDGPPAALAERPLAGRGGLRDLMNFMSGGGMRIWPSPC